MMRDDYEKLIKIGPKEFNEPYFLQTIYTDNVFSGLAKLRRTDTAMIDSWYKEWKPRHYGIFIDIIVMDMVPDDERLFLSQCKKVLKMERLFTRKHVLRSDCSNIRALLRTVYVESFFIVNGGFKKAYQRFVRMLVDNKNIPHKRCGKVEVDLQWTKNKKINLRDCTWYDETIELPFHDMNLPAPKEYDKVLTGQFGNYMVPVKGDSCHNIIIIDANKSYIEALKELKFNS